MCVHIIYIRTKIIMCDKWQKNYFKKYGCKGAVLHSGDGDYIVRGKVLSRTSKPTIVYWAANPPTYISSYSGSGLPYPNPLIAYENTINRGAVIATSNQFEFKIHYPNSYYTGLGTVLVAPHVDFKICEPGSNEKIYTIQLGESIPFRTLTYSPLRSSSLFYKGKNKMPIVSQEELLRRSSYPNKNKTPDNFWGKAAPQN